MTGKEKIRLALACAATALLTALALGALWYGAIGGAEGAALWRKVQAVEHLLTQEYVGDTGAAALADGAAAGMVAAIDDPWSYYMTAEQLRAYEDRSANQSHGIGVTVTVTEAGDIQVVSVTAGTPAEAAGIKAGEQILAAAGQTLPSGELETLKTIIAAQTGDFELRLRGTDGRERLVTVHTADFYTDPVRYELLPGGQGYIAIANFESGAAERSIAAVETLLEQGADSLIFDVRNDPGGKLSELIDLLDALLPEGDIFVSVGKDGKEQVYTSDPQSVDVPMAVLINSGTYSAAEFFAAALREYDKAVLIGQPSTGKARSQMTYELADGSAVHISTRRYLTPQRVDLAEQGGLIPDILAEEGPDDAALAAATKYLS